MCELYDMQNQIFLQETKGGLLTILVKMAKYSAEDSECSRC